MGMGRMDRLTNMQCTHPCRLLRELRLADLELQEAREVHFHLRAVAVAALQAGEAVVRFLAVGGHNPTLGQIKSSKMNKASNMDQTMQEIS